jgi:hypothetical protein
MQMKKRRKAMSNKPEKSGDLSNWNGLWWHPEYGNFSSAPFTAEALPKLGEFRICVKKNPNYNNGKKQSPNYLFSIKSVRNKNAINEQASSDDMITRIKENIDKLSPDQIEIIDKLIRYLMK